MTTVAYDVVVTMTVEIDAADLIDDCARSLIECSVDDIGDAVIHDLDINPA